MVRYVKVARYLAVTTVLAWVASNTHFIRIDLLIMAPLRPTVDTRNEETGRCGLLQHKPALCLGFRLVDRHDRHVNVGGGATGNVGNGLHCCCTCWVG